MSQAPSFDEQLAALAAAGICPRPGTARESLLYNWPEEAWKQHPFHRLFDLIEHSDDIDESCLCAIEDDEDHDIYGRTARMLAALSKGRLPLAEIRSHVDVYGTEAFLAFSLDDKDYRFDFKVDHPWMDFAVFTHLNALLQARCPDHAFYVLSPDPLQEGMMLVCLDRSQREHLLAAGATLQAIDQPRA